MMAAALFLLLIGMSAKYKSIIDFLLFDVVFGKKGKSIRS